MSRIKEQTEDRARASRMKYLSRLIPIFAIIVALGLLFTSPGSAALADAPPGLVLWNKLGSETEILNSAFGPNLSFYADTDCSYVGCIGVEYHAVPEYIPGVFGGALTIGPGDYDGGVSRVHNVVLRDANNYINPERGTVEAWFKQTADGMPYLYGDYRVFDGAFGLLPGIVFGTNDTLGNGVWRFQFGIQFGGTDAEVNSLADGQIGYDVSPHNNTWIHLAGVWDRNGIAGTSDTLRLYVDGVPVAFTTDKAWGTTVGPFVDIGGGNASEIAEKFAVDNLKLWNYAKTDFSDRFSEGPEEPTAIEVKINIRPLGPFNIIPLKSKGLIPVAILSDANFDPTSVDSQSVKFGPNGAAPVHQQERRDVNKDHRPDLVLFFRIQDIGIKQGDKEACLTGSTTGGVLIHGCDKIRTIP